MRRGLAVDFIGCVDVLTALQAPIASLYAVPMVSAALSRRVERVVGYPPLSEMSELQRLEFQEALLQADAFEDLPGKWQAAV